jgi:hypothetical protein
VKGSKVERGRPLKIYVSDEDRIEIEARAAAARLTVSAYLRTLGLNHTPRNMIDQDAVLELARINGDQGRLGGLLKLWLTDMPGKGASVIDVRRVLHQIEETQRQLLAVVERI